MGLLQLGLVPSVPAACTGVQAAAAELEVRADLSWCWRAMLVAQLVVQAGAHCYLERMLRWNAAGRWLYASQTWPPGWRARWACLLAALVPEAVGQLSEQAEPCTSLTCLSE